MENRANLIPFEVAISKCRAELALVHEIGIPGAIEIEKLRPTQVRNRRKIIDDQNLLLTCAVEFVDEIASDESGAAGYDDHLPPSCVAVSFLTMFVVENPSTVGTISTLPPYAMTSSWPTTVSMV